MSTRDTTYEALHTWVRTYADLGSTLATDKVIPAYDGGGRPSDEYIVLYQSSHGLVDQHDEVIHSLDDDDNVAIEIRGVRSGTVQIHGYGAGTDVWLQNLTWSLKHPDAQLLNHEAGITVLAPTSGIRQVPRMENANLEPHFVLEFPYTYRVTSGTIALANAPAADTAEVDATLYELDPETDPLVVNIVVDTTV